MNSFFSETRQKRAEVFDTVVLPRLGIRGKMFRNTSATLFNGAMDTWQDDYTDAEDIEAVRADWKKRIQQKVGFGPIVLLLLGAILNALILWWFKKRGEMHSTMRVLRG